MKVTFLFLMTVGLAGLALENIYAAPFSPAWQQAATVAADDSAKNGTHDSSAAATVVQPNRQKDRTSSDGQGNRNHGSNQNHPASRPGKPNSNHLSKSPNSARHSTTESALNHQQPHTGQSGPPVSSKGTGQGKALKRTSPSHQTGVTQNAIPSSANLRRRDPNPALVGGPANATTRNSGAINGTNMNRRP